MAVSIRPARLPDDAPGIAALDASYETEAIDRIEDADRGFRIVRTPIPKVTKRFWVYDLESEDRDWDEAHVAVEDDRIVGFSCSSWQFWNRRVILWHVYVDRPYRGGGLGRRLLEPVFARAKRQRANCVYLETSNHNTPGIDWYQRQGFRFGGLDTTLYDGREGAAEVGVYMVKFLGR